MQEIDGVAGYWGQGYVQRQLHVIQGKATKKLTKTKLRVSLVGIASKHIVGLQRAS